MSTVRETIDLQVDNNKRVSASQGVSTNGVSLCFVVLVVINSKRAGASDQSAASERGRAIYSFRRSRISNSEQRVLSGGKHERSVLVFCSSCFYSLSKIRRKEGLLTAV